MTIGDKQINQLISDPQTSVTLTFLHPLVSDFAARVSYAARSSNCRNCRKTPFIEDLTVKARGMLSTLSEENRQKLRSHFGVAEVFLEDKQKKRIKIA